MRPIEPAELSAFIDGELEEPRAAEVRAALAADATLRERHAGLLQADAHFSALAQTLTLHPQVRWPTPAPIPASAFPMGRGLAVGLLAVAAWLSARMPVESLGLVVGALALAALIVTVVVLVREEEKAMSLLLSGGSRES